MTPEQRDYYVRTRKPVLPMPTTRVGRFGCGIALVVWFTLLMTPCALFWLAFQGDIILNHASIPEAQIHPFLQIGLVMDTETRGLRITRSIPQTVTEQAMCVETWVDYFVWQSDGGAESARYCDCYSRTSSTSPWFDEGRTNSHCAEK